MNINLTSRLKMMRKLKQN